MDQDAERVAWLFAEESAAWRAVGVTSPLEAERWTRGNGAVAYVPWWTRLREPVGLDEAHVECAADSSLAILYITELSVDGEASEFQVSPDLNAARTRIGQWATRHLIDRAARGLLDAHDIDMDLPLEDRYGPVDAVEAFAIIRSAKLGFAARAYPATTGTVHVARVQGQAATDLRLQNPHDQWLRVQDLQALNGSGTVSITVHAVDIT